MNECFNINIIWNYVSDGWFQNIVNNKNQNRNAYLPHAAAYLVRDVTWLEHVGQLPYRLLCSKDYLFTYKIDPPASLRAIKFIDQWATYAVH